VAVTIFELGSDVDGLTALAAVTLTDWSTSSRGEHWETTEDGKFLVAISVVNGDAGAKTVHHTHNS
jgi:hypothetical protein